ncbi:MAG: sigma-70 family RNA polymerase sigma factor [Bacteroidia bacterium]
MTINVTEEMEINTAILAELMELRNKKNQSRIDSFKYDKCFIKALDKFSYIVTIHSNKYKKFSNFEDLHQEGMMGLVLALNKFDPIRSKNFFKIANWYIKTRIKRAANKYNVITVPMNVGKKLAMNRIAELPIVIDQTINPHDGMEQNQVINTIIESLKSLNELQKSVICMYYGIDKEFDIVEHLKDKNSISFIAKEMNLSRASVEKILSEAYTILSSNKDIINLAP